MTAIRSPAVAGTFYPADEQTLRAMVTHYLEAVHPSGAVPKALIVPHAGYVYSGPVAAMAYARLRAARQRITRVILLGPAHWVAVRGLAGSSAEMFVTPLGAVPVDRAAMTTALTLPQVDICDDAQIPEHSVEVQLPFLQVVLETFAVVPLLIGEATPTAVGEVLELLWGEAETLIVISSDLSHYYDYETAQRLDRATSRAIEALRPADIGIEQACGRCAIQGLLQVVPRHGLRAETIALRNSGDTAGPTESVVGYGAYAFAA
jgi:AmmeMemoRadiSam system protein B